MFVGLFVSTDIYPSEKFSFKINLQILLGIVITSVTASEFIIKYSETRL